MKYELIEATDTYPAILKRTNKDGEVTWIPTDPANSDYQRYLNPEAEQSTPNLTE